MELMLNGWRIFSRPVINSGLPMHDPIARDRDQNVGQLLQILATHDWVDGVS